MTTNVAVVPACPNCADENWRFWEGGDYQSEHSIDPDGFGGWKFTRIDHEEEIESSYFWCATCDLNKGDLMMDPRLEDAWDVVQGQLYDLRDQLPGYDQ